MSSSSESQLYTIQEKQIHFRSKMFDGYNQVSDNFVYYTSEIVHDNQKHLINVDEFQN